MKRILLCGLLAVIVVGGSGGQAMAAPSTTMHQGVSLSCPLLVTPGGTAALSILYSEDLSLVSSTLWHPGDSPGEDQPWLQGFDEDPPVVDESALHLTIALTDQSTGELVDGVVDAVLTPAGSPSTVSERQRSGNTWFRSSVTTTPATVSGTYAVPGAGAFDLSACAAELVAVETFATQPAAYVANSGHVSMSCRIDTGDEDIAVSASAESRAGHVDGESSVAVFPYVGGDAAVYFGSGSATISRTAIAGTVDLTDDSGTTRGTATVAVRLSVVDVERIRFTEDGTTSTARIETLGVEGTLQLPDGRAFDLDDCSAMRVAGVLVTHPA